MKINLLFIYLLLSITSLFGSNGLNNENSIQTIPVHEVNGNAMPTAEQQIKELYSNEEGPLPVVFRGAAKHWGAATWTPEYFEKNFGDVRILVRLLEDGKFRGQHIATTIGDHIKDITFNPKNACYFDGLHNNFTVMDDLEDSEDSSIAEGISIFIRDRLNLESQTQFPQAARTGEELLNSCDVVWIGAENTVTPLHAHASTFLTQIYGEKLATLAHPKYATKCSFAESEDSDDIVADTVNPDFEKFPELKNVKFYRTILRPGDILYIPNNWLHEIRGLNTSISIAEGF